MAFTDKPITYEEFLNLIRKSNVNADIEMVSKAYKFAENAHKDQVRAAGQPFFEHPLETARILINMKADTATICAALLHDTVEDTSTPLEVVEKEFGQEIAVLVEGVTKHARRFESKEEYKAENLRKVLLASTKDVRVLLIKLADRLHNMRTLATFRDDKRKRIAQETIEIYAAIAHKLGLWRIKGELEDLSFRYMDPPTYRRLKEQVHGTRAEREEVTKKIVEKIRRELEAKNIVASVKGRAKYFYSIYKKMLRKQRDFDQIYDLLAIRIVVKSIPECYKVLDILHTLYTPQMDRFKDYIQYPKANNYQSIHTSVLYEGKILEIQIRTEDMHYIDEYGIAAHWQYKMTEKDKKFDRKIMWLRQILEWLSKSENAQQFVENLKIDLFENEIIVLTPKGDPISLPEKATPVDFAYAVHSRVGDRCSKAKVNGKIERLDIELHSGDVVEIITQNNAKPSRNWLNFVVTGKARSKIRSALGIETDTRKRTEEVVEKKYLLGKIAFDGKKNILKISKCCDPNYGDPIVAFYTKDGRVTIHKQTCVNIHALDATKQVPLQWIPEESVQKLRVYVDETPSILVEILNLLSKNNLKVKSVNTRIRKKRVLLSFKILSDPRLEDVLEIIRQNPAVTEVKIDN